MDSKDDEKLEELRRLLEEEDEKNLERIMVLVESMQQEAFLSGYIYAIEVLKEGLLKKQK